MPSALDAIVSHYLDSRDFNGLRYGARELLPVDEVAALIRDGLVELVGEADFPNPSIKPWPTRRPAEAQIEALRLAAAGKGDVCLYPTATALASKVDAARYVESPFSRRLLLGAGQLESAFFRIDVLEPYRNDPRFRFDVHDFGVDICITDDEFRRSSTPDLDKTSISHVGFAYELSNDEAPDAEAPIRRHVCAALRDLADLTPEHQQRWRTYELAACPGLAPHPVWSRIQAGHWPDAAGPFDRLLSELTAWSELHRRAFGMELLRRLEREREFGWVLRPSQHEYDAFIQHLDKLLADNIQHSALDALGAPDKDPSEQKLGTLKRIDRYLEMRGVREEDRRDAMTPLYSVREARNKPAHTLRTNLTDETLVRRQAAVLRDVTRGVMQLRRFWERFPQNSDWEPPRTLKSREYYWL